MTTVERRTVSALATRPREAFPNRLADGVLYLTALTSSWTTVAVGGNNLVDYFLLAALATLVLARLNGTRKIYVSFWMLLPLLAGISITTWAVVVGGDQSPESTMQLRVFLSTAAVAILLTAVAVGRGRPVLIRLLRLWAVGISISGMIAILTSYGIVNPAEVFVQKSGERLSGLTSHPNALSFSLVMGIPVAVYLMGAARTAWRSIGWAVLAGVMLWGLILTGSRAGLIVGLPALAVATLLWMRSTRLRPVLLPLTILLAIALAFTIPTLLAGTRLVQGAEDSDYGRVLINSAAMEWFYESPIFGGGFDVMHGVAVPIMVLSGGGIILALGYYFFLLRPIPVLIRGRAQFIAQMGMLSIGVFLAFGILNPVWMERITYWPVLIASLTVLVDKQRNDGNPWSSRDSLDSFPSS